MKPVTYASPIEALRQALQYAGTLFLGRGHTGPVFRRALLVASFVLYWFVLAVLADFPRMLPEAFLLQMPFAIGLLIDLVSSFFAPEIILHLIPVIAAIALGFWAGSMYLADLFELESSGIAFRYLRSAVLGISHPHLVINTGDVDLLDQNNPLLRIGGPGYLHLHLGFAALFETVAGEPRVYGQSGAPGSPGTTFIQGFERLRDVVDLRPQLARVQEVRASTRDGIEVQATDAKVLFRVHGGVREGDPEVPYAFTESGIRCLIYGQIVSSRGPGRWSQALPGLVQDEVRRFVANHTLDQILSISRERQQPAYQPASDRRAFHIPRRQLTARFHSEGTPERLRKQGLKLIWIDVGTWEIRDDQARNAKADDEHGSSLTTIWRDLYRTHRFRSQEYLERSRRMGYYQYPSEVLYDLINTWKHSQTPENGRCYMVLSKIKSHLRILQEQVQADSEQSLPDDYGAAIQHLESVTHWEPLDSG